MNQNIITLNKFIPRSYQLDVIEKIESGYKNILLAWSRRAGKDYTLFNESIRIAISRTCTIYYIFPSFNGGRRILWDAITIDGVKFLDLIPNDICKKNSSEMKITFFNGSIIQIVGSENYNRLRGTNPYVCIFSEFAYQDPAVYDVVRPILAANNGIAIFASTPNGKNEFYKLYKKALTNPKWFVQKLDVYQTAHIPEDRLKEEKEKMSEEMFAQEYLCSFDRGVDGGVYTKYINKLYLEDRIGLFPYMEGYPVNTAWDIGVDDSTSIVFFQVINKAVYVIDYYEHNHEGLPHYLQVLHSKNYVYGEHFAPHDGKNQEWGKGLTRVEQAYNYNLNFNVIPKGSLFGGIELTRVAFSRISIDSKKCDKLIQALTNYHFIYDEKKEDYSKEPYHDKYEHGASAFRYMCLALEYINNEKLEDNDEELVYSSMGERSYGRL